MNTQREKEEEEQSRGRERESEREKAWMWHDKYQLDSNDNCIFYESPNVHLDNGEPVEKIQNTLTKIKKNAVNVRGKHVLYLYKTQNQPSQSTMWNMFDYWSPPIPRSADVLTFLIKKGSSTCFAFFDSLILLWWTRFTYVQQRFRQSAPEFKCPQCDSF